MKPTKEQQAIIEAARENSHLKVVARAGAGKSSTIKMMVKDCPKKSIYLVFNKSLQEEAMEWAPDHLDVKTMNALAFGYKGHELKHKLSPGMDKVYINRLRTTKELKNYFKLKDIDSKTGGDSLSAMTLAAYLKEAMNRWEKSPMMQIDRKHLPLRKIKQSAEGNDWDIPHIEKVLLKHLKEWWEYRIDPTHPAKIDHETYTKLWQLSEPVLPYERVYLDEAQDIFPTILDVIHKQPDSVEVMMVGDDKQSIYMFTGAINSLDKFDYPTLRLTQSFRYGEAIAAVASLVFPEEVIVRGNPTVESSLAKVDESKPYTYLFRTNADLVAKGVELVSEGKKVYMEFNVSDFKKKLESVMALKKKDMKNVVHPEIAIHNSFPDLLEEAKNNPELGRLAGMVKKRDKYKEVMVTLDDYRKPRKWDVMLCTAHKSKGREWKQVKLADDFPTPEREDLVVDGEKWSVVQELSEAEQNLLYVAITRAEEVLEINELVAELVLKRKVQKRV